MASYLVINLNLFFALQWCSQIMHLDFIIISDKSFLCSAHRKTFTVQIDTVVTQKVQTTLLVVVTSNL